MNNYITLNGKKYKTSAKDWMPAQLTKPGTVRVLANGEVDASYGPGVLMRWSGSVLASVTPEKDFGTLADLMEALSLPRELLFTDHYGNSYYVHVVGEIKVKSMVNMWDAGSNRFSVNLNMIKSRNA